MPRDQARRGLGLRFCKLATVCHGGSIAIEENEPRGTIFVVRLPLGGPAAARAD